MSRCKTTQISICLYYKMSRYVDFTVSNLASATGKLLRPGQSSSRHSQPPPKQNQHKIPKMNITIEKTLPVANTHINIPQAHLKLMEPQLQALGAYAKQLSRKQKDIKKAIAQEIIKPESLNKQPLKDQESVQEDIVIDKSGKMRDKKGNLVYVKTSSRQLLANRNKEKEMKLRQMQFRQRKGTVQKLSRKLITDSNVISKTGKSRIRRSIAGLNFFERSSQQTALLDEAKPQHSSDDQLNAILKDKSQSQSEEQPISKPKALPRRTVRTKEVFQQSLVTKQWWDVQLLNCQDYKPLWKVSKVSELPQQLINMNFITPDIQTGNLFKKVAQQQVIMPTFLTKDQRKKLKRRRKQQRLKAKNDLIRLGQVKPDPPKLKLSNMALVLKDQFVLDPSRVESEVKKQMKERVDKHMEANESRKLTKEKRAQKALRKLKRDSAKQSHTAIFRVESVKDRTIRYKIEMNAKQLALNGLFLVPTQGFNGPAVIIIEGGRRAVKFFKNLMLRRINWKESYLVNLMTKEQIESQSIDPLTKVESPGNRCRLVWQAVITENSFNKWRSEFVSRESDAIGLLSQRKVQHYWQTVMNYKDQS